MKTYVVVEGPSDRDLLAAAFRQAGTRASGYHLIAAGGRSSAISTAVSLLATRDNPVALIIDADAVDSSVVQTQRLIVTESFDRVAPRSPYLLLLAQPSIEAVLFESERSVKAALGRTLRPAEAVQAKLDPKQLLMELAKKEHKGDVQSLLAGDGVGVAVAQSELFKSLSRFIKKSSAKKSQIAAA